VLCVRVLVDVHEPRDSRVDVLGTATFTGSAAALTYALIRANERGWSNALTWWLFAASAVLLAAFLVVEHRSAHPMFDLALLRNAPFVGVLVGGLLLTFAAFSLFTYTSIWLQSVLGLTPIQAGLVGLPMSLSSFGVSAGIGRFLHGGGQSGRIIGGGLLCIGVGDLIAAALTHGSASWPALILGLFVSGVGVGLATPTLGSSAMAAVPPQRGGMAAGAANTARQLGFAFGIATLGSVFTARAQGVLSDHGVPSAAGVARAVAGGQSRRLLAQIPVAARGTAEKAIRASAVAGVQSTLLVAGLVGLLAAALVFALMRPVADSGLPAAERAQARAVSAE
jgi:predicted MFS family arabinose efflux permease